MRTRWLRRIALVGVLLVAFSVGPDALANRGGGEVSAREDNPSGCTTATAEAQEQCGAQGRDHFANEAHRPPIEACATRPTEAGGRITRIRPDGPRHPDGSMAFVPGACVYLPPGYDKSKLDYPVVYLLHGGGGDQSAWVTFGSVETILDAAISDDPSAAVIAVMPDGRSGQWYDYEDGSFLFETYVLGHLVPFVDQRFRTIADRSGRAIAGLSNGGYGAIHFAAKRPDLFVAAGGMSSNIGGRTFAGLGADGAVHHQGSVPYQLASNLNDVDVILDIATSCSSDVTVDLCATLAVDLLFWPDHVALDARMADVGHEGDFDYRETEGGHKWRWWSEWFRTRDLPFILDRVERARRSSPPIEPTGVPETFRYRSIAPSFDVWEHHVEVDRDVREFIDLTEVTRLGFTVQGSGTARITTAPRYSARRTYRVDGAGDRPVDVVADRSGRLTITVDLGPSHSHDQFTDEADAAEAQGDYWVTRTVTISPDGSPGSPRGIEPIVDEDASTDGSPVALAFRGRVDTTSDDDAGAGVARSDASTTTDATAVDTDPVDDASIDEVASRVIPTGTSEPGPQLVPTLLFLLLLAGGPVYWWHRHRRLEVEA